MKLNSCRYLKKSEGTLTLLQLLAVLINYTFLVQLPTASNRHTEVFVLPIRHLQVSMVMIVSHCYFGSKGN